MSDEPVNPNLELPEDFDDYEWEVEAKGYFHDALVEYVGLTYRIAFYDATRLAQDVQSELKYGLAVLPNNLVVVDSVTRAAMTEAVRRLFRDGVDPRLTAD